MALRSTYNRAFLHEAQQASQSAQAITGAVSQTRACIWTCRGYHNSGMSSAQFRPSNMNVLSDTHLIFVMDCDGKRCDLKGEYDEQNRNILCREKYRLKG